VTFKAQYNPIIYTATFLNESGVAIATRNGTYGAVITPPDAPPKVGHAFTQWKEDGGTVTIPSGTATYTLLRDITFKPEYVEVIIEIRTQAELNEVRNYLVGKYKLMNDIALDSNGAGFDVNGWLPMGAFTGIFDGNGHKITGLWIDRGSMDNVGLFGLAQSATIKNLGVEIGSRGVRGRYQVGGIVGHVVGGTIANSYSTGSVSGSADGVGGIAGYMQGSSSIINSYSTGSVSGSRHQVGGIVGLMQSSSSIINSYSTGSVSGSSYNVGGIVGLMQSSSSIINSYSTGSVSGGDSVGGIVGDMESSSTTNSYSTGSVSVSGQYVGGIAGIIDGGSITNNAAINPSVSGRYNVNRIVGYIRGGGTASNNFALNTMTVSGKIDGNAGTSKTIAQLKTQSTYSNPVNGDGRGGLGWKFGNDDANPWKIASNKNNGLPYLYWENR
jgi:hypothetical protein